MYELVSVGVGDWEFESAYRYGNRYDYVPLSLQAFVYITKYDSELTNLKAL